MQSQAAMQQQYLCEVQEVNSQPSPAEGPRVAMRRISTNEIQPFKVKLSSSGKELRETQELAEANSIDLRAKNQNSMSTPISYPLSGLGSAKLWRFRPRYGNNMPNPYPLRLLKLFRLCKWSKMRVRKKLITSPRLLSTLALN